MIERYEPYAPGLDPAASRCGLAIVDTDTAAVEAQLWWPNGLQIYEVQVLPAVVRPRSRRPTPATTGNHCGTSDDADPRPGRPRRCRAAIHLAGWRSRPTPSSWPS